MFSCKYHVVGRFLFDGVVFLSEEVGSVVAGQDVRYADDVCSDAFSHHVVGNPDLTVTKCAVSDDGVGYDALVIASDVCWGCNMYAK